MPFDWNIVKPEFVDCDFRTQPQYVMGDLGPDAAKSGLFRDYEDVVKPLTLKEIDEEIERIEHENAGIENLITRIFNQGQEGSCFPPGTLITMATGEQRPIEDVKCLESVVTAEGNVGEVRQTMARPFIGQLVGVHLHGNNLVRCTPEHPILTKRGYVAAESLEATDWVAIPKVRPAVVNTVQTAAFMPYQTRCVNERRVKKFNAPAGRTLTQVQIEPVPDFLTLDADLGRIIGLFLAEGNCDKQKIVWTFNISELDTLVVELQDLLLRRLGVETKLRVAGHRTTAKVEMYGTLWARLFEGICATGSGQKRLCAELASGPPEFLRAVFEGWMAGDGNFGKDTNTGVTVSRQLAVQMFQIASRFGMHPALRRSEPKLNGNVKSRQPRYDLTFGNAGHDDCWRRSQDDTHCWRRVRILTKEDYKGPVYNFHVHGDESYVADGLGVHNCVGNAATQAQQIVQAKQFGKDKVTQLSASSLYQLIGRSPGSGAMVSDAYDELQKVGVVPLDNAENRARFGDVVMPHTGFYTKRPKGCEAVAANFRIDEGFVVRTYEGLLTAGVKGDPAVVGRAGHSITHLRPTKKDGRRYQLYVNSWSENWGFGLAGFKGGFGLDSESYARSSAGWAFVIRSVPVPNWIV